MTDPTIPAGAGDAPADPMLDLRRVRQFVTLGETLNFRRAADRLHMTQPPLTVAIQKLEAELGTRLFERGARAASRSPQAGMRPWPRRAGCCFITPSCWRRRAPPPAPAAP